MPRDRRVGGGGPRQEFLDGLGHLIAFLRLSALISASMFIFAWESLSHQFLIIVLCLFASFY